MHSRSMNTFIFASKIIMMLLDIVKINFHTMNNIRIFRYFSCKTTAIQFQKSNVLREFSLCMIHTFESFIHGVCLWKTSWKEPDISYT